MGGRRGRKRRRRQGPAKGAASPTASRANFLRRRRVPEMGAYRGRGPLSRGTACLRRETPSSRPRDST